MMDVEKGNGRSWGLVEGNDGYRAGRGQKSEGSGCERTMNES